MHAKPCLRLLSSVLAGRQPPIAKKYVGIGGKRNAERYWKFMGIAKTQAAALAVEGYAAPDLLKAIDECNYCKFSMPVTETRRAKRKN